MSLSSFYFNKQDTDKLSYLGRRYLYIYELEKELAQDRLRKLFRVSKLDLIVDEVC